jgi:hypothetical protein
VSLNALCFSFSFLYLGSLFRCACQTHDVSTLCAYNRISYFVCNVRRLAEDQRSALNAFGGKCAKGVTISADTPKDALEAIFAKQANLYFFYAAESKNNHPEVWRSQFFARPIGTGAKASTFVHVFDEAHVGDTWRNFRAAFSNFKALVAGSQPHHLVIPLFGVLDHAMCC